MENNLPKESYVDKLRKIEKEIVEIIKAKKDCMKRLEQNKNTNKYDIDKCIKLTSELDTTSPRSLSSTTTPLSQTLSRISSQITEDGKKRTEEKRTEDGKKRTEEKRTEEEKIEEEKRRTEEEKIEEEKRRTEEEKRRTEEEKIKTREEDEEISLKISLKTYSDKPVGIHIFSGNKKYNGILSLIKYYLKITKKKNLILEQFNDNDKSINISNEDFNINKYRCTHIISKKNNNIDDYIKVLIKIAEIHNLYILINNNNKTVSIEIIDTYNNQENTVNIYKLREKDDYYKLVINKNNKNYNLFKTKLDEQKTMEKKYLKYKQKYLQLKNLLKK